MGNRAEGSMALQGRKLFLAHECLSCHNVGHNARAPTLEGLYGSTVHLRDGTTVIADDNYLRESILYPQAKIVQGWEPIMPTFKGQLADRREGQSLAEKDMDEEEALLLLVAYIKSLRPGQTPVPTEEFPPPVGAPTVPPGGSKP
jgi:cytochrome c oxidase subunit 2